MYRKRVPQVRAREDLVRVLTRDLAFGLKGLVCSFQANRSTDIPNRSTDCNDYCSFLLSGWGSVDFSAVSVDRFVGIGRPIWHCSMPLVKL